MEYIYPSGNTGKILARMVEYVHGACPSCIDDSICGNGIEDYKEEILCKGASVLLAWDKKSGWNDVVIGQLITKLQKLGIPYDENAMDMYALKVVKKLKEEVLNKKAKYCVGIELGGMAEDKHIGILDDALREVFNGEVLLVYFCGFEESYKRIMQKIKNENYAAFVVCLSPYDLYLVDFVDVLCKVSWTQKNPAVQTIEIGHSMGDFSKCDVDAYSAYFDFLCISGNDFYPKKKPSNVVCIKSGYLAFDATQLPQLSSGGGGFYLMLMMRKNYKKCFLS